MTILRDVLHELWSMFVGDARLSLAVLALIGATAALARVSAAAAGVALLVGCLAILGATTLRAARRKARQPR